MKATKSSQSVWTSIKLILAACFFAMTSIFVSTVAAQEAGPAANIEIKGVKSMQFIEARDELITNLVVIFSNSNKNNIRLDSANFDVTMTGTLQTFPPRIIKVSIGAGNLNDTVIPAVSDSNPSGTKEVLISINMGRQNESTKKKLLDMLNLIGDPQIKKTITLKGESDFSIAVPRGWVTQRRIGVDLTYTPKFMNSVLLE
jgi:hypothetical protein